MKKIKPNESWKIIWKFVKEYFWVFETLNLSFWKSIVNKFDIWVTW